MAEQLALEFGPGEAACPIPEIAERLADRPHFALYSKSRERKDAYIDTLRRRNPGFDVLFLCPKALLERARVRHPGAVVVAIEQFTQRETFLRLHALAGPRTLLVMENVARYTLLSSDKFNCLHRLRMATERRYLLDVVPFHRAVCKLYLPWSYLDREILQYSNGWAFEYNYLEEDSGGRVRRAHDPDFLAEKIGPWCWVDYPAFLPLIEPVEVVLTPGERERYAARKAELFTIYNNPRKIVTELADCSNMMPSRYTRLGDVLEQIEGRVVVFTNIVKNNAIARRHLRSRRIRARVEVRTYMTHRNEPIEADAVVLLETPINANAVAVIDVLADIPPAARVFHLRDDSKADVYVRGEVEPEWQAIDTLTRELWRQQ